MSKFSRFELRIYKCKCSTIGVDNEVKLSRHRQFVLNSNEIYVIFEISERQFLYNNSKDVQRKIVVFLLHLKHCGPVN